MFTVGQNILLWGEFAERKTRLHFMLRKLGLEVCSNLSEKIDCIIVGRERGDNLPTGYPCFTERQALVYLQQELVQPFTLKAQQLEPIQNLRLLLQHPEQVNRQLGLNLVQEQMRPYCYSDLLFAYLEYSDKAVYNYVLEKGNPSIRQAFRNAEVLSLEDIAIRVREVEGEYLAELFWRKSQQNRRKSEARHFLLKYSNTNALRQAVLQGYVQEDGRLLLHDFLVEHCAPQDFALLKQVSSVSLNGLYFQTLPEALLRLPKIKELHLCNVAYSDTWQFPALNQLSTLRFSEMRLDRVVRLVQQASKNLGQLGLTNIAAAPAADWEKLYQVLETFPQLQGLSIIGCQLKELPPLQRFPQLSAADLSNNAITKLPAHSDALHRLRRFSLYGNQLQCLPVGLFEDTPLEEVVLSNNSPQLDDWLYAKEADYFPENCEVKYDNVR